MMALALPVQKPAIIPLVEEITHSNAEAEQTRDLANAWVAQFAPLVMGDTVPTEPEVRRRINDCLKLRSDGDLLRSRLSAISTTDPELVQTFDQASRQLDSIEVDFRRQLAKLIPGDPDGIADLDQIQERLAERSARQEIGLETEASIPEVLELKVGPPNRATAVGIGVFGLGWTAFTAVHAIIMIGGMFAAFGWPALALLAFYSIFFLAGFAMLAAAADAASTENIVLDHRRLTVIKSLGPWIRKRTYELPQDAQATISEMAVTRVRPGNQSSKPTPVVQLHDVSGDPIGFGANATDFQRRQTLERVNAYLKLRT
jgi:hypothetical protein